MMRSPNKIGRSAAGPREGGAAKAEASLEISGEVLAAIGVAVLAVDHKGLCRHANPAALTLFGVSELGGLLGKDMHDLLHGRQSGDPTAHSLKECPINRALERGAVTHITREAVTLPNGERIEVECRAYPMSRGGEISGAALVLTDMSAHRRVEEENLFRKVLLDAQSEASIDGILVVSSDTKMLSFNRRFVDLWGVPQHIVESRSDELALSWVLQKLQDPQAFTAKVAHLYAHPDQESRDLIALKDGRFFDRYSTPVKSSEGVYYGRVWFFRDITDLKRAEAEMSRLYDEAQKAVHLRDEFLSIASHELRTPLTALQLATQSFLRRIAKSEAPEIPTAWAKERVTGVLDLLDRLSTLIDTLLDISRLTAGRLVLTPETLDFSALVREVVGRHEEQLSDQGCALTVRAEHEIMGCWDRLRIEQILSNLLSNASKYGAGKPVEVKVEHAAAQVHLSVRDQGIGIPAGDRKRVFERFERAVSSYEYGGFGLGLWIVSEIVKAMGGDINIDETPGGGATFTVSLPLALPELAPEPGAT